MQSPPTPRRSIAPQFTWAGLLAYGSHYSPRLPLPNFRKSGIMQLSSPITAAGPQRIFTVFPSGPFCLRICKSRAGHPLAFELELNFKPCQGKNADIFQIAKKSDLTHAVIPMIIIDHLYVSSFNARKSGAASRRPPGTKAAIRNRVSRYIRSMSSKESQRNQSIVVAVNTGFHEFLKRIHGYASIHEGCGATGSFSTPAADPLCSKSLKQTPRHETRRG